MPVKINLNNRIFRALSNSPNGEVSDSTLFYYKQSDDLITAEYKGGEIVMGTIVGKIVNNNHLEFEYRHTNVNGEIRTGVCRSYPEIVDSGKVILKEYWQWTCADCSKGESTLIEL